MIASRSYPYDRGYDAQRAILRRLSPVSRTHKPHWSTMTLRCFVDYICKGAGR